MRLHPFYLYACCLLIMMFSIIMLLTQPISTQLFWINESGPIESASAISYLICMIFILLAGRAAYLKSHFPLPLLMLLFALRELDFDKRFTVMGILKTRFYSSADVPLYQKLIGALVTILLIYLVGRLLTRYTRYFITHFFKGEPVVIGTALSLGLLVVSKTLDGLARKLAPLDVHFTPATNHLLELLEENFELAAPIMMLLTFYVFFRQQRISDSGPENSNIKN